MPFKLASIMDEYLKNQSLIDARLLEDLDKIRKAYLEKLEAEASILKTAGNRKLLQSYENEIKSVGKNGATFRAHFSGEKTSSIQSNSSDHNIVGAWHYMHNGKRINVSIFGDGTFKIWRHKANWGVWHAEGSKITLSWKTNIEISGTINLKSNEAILETVGREDLSGTLVKAQASPENPFFGAWHGSTVLGTRNITFFGDNTFGVPNTNERGGQGGKWHIIEEGKIHIKWGDGQTGAAMLKSDGTILLDAPESRKISGVFQNYEG